MSVFAQIGEHSLSRKLRAAGTNGIVIAAAKDFIPYLFGAWDSDVCLWPRDVAPQVFPAPRPFSGRFGFEIVFDLWTKAGADAVSDAHAAIEKRFADMANVLPSSEAQMFRPGTATGTRTLYWALPQAWGTTRPRVLGEWFDALPQIADAIDDFYSDVCQIISHHLPEPRAILQSCFATDAAGHRDGPSSREYETSVEASVARARRMHDAGWTIAVVSDHGGRDTPETWFHDPSTAPSTVTAGQTRHHMPASIAEVLSGDHLVGYGPGDPIAFRGLTANSVIALVVPPELTLRSFHPLQVPAWITVPPVGVNIGKNGRPPIGGNHGACHDGTGLSDVDNEVGAWTLPVSLQKFPVRLEEVAAWFLSLR